MNKEIADILNKNKDKIIEMRLNRIQLKDIADKFGVEINQLKSFFKKYNITIRTKRDDISDGEIISMYKDGKGIHEIGSILHINHNYISNVLDKNNIKKRSISEINRKYYLNEHYFDNINTPNKAYILGFFYADGCNSKMKGTISMSLKEDDKEILEKIRLEISSEKELEFINQSKRKDKNNNYHYGDMYRLLLFSNHMCDALEKHGMMPNKSLTLEFPKDLNENLYSHFIRGYFDGDGSFCARYTKKGWFQCLITFTSTDSFCKDIQNIFIKNLDIKGGIYDASCHNGVTKVLSISGTNQDRKILDWLYKDADLYMKRKHDLYLKYLTK